MSALTIQEAALAHRVDYTAHGFKAPFGGAVVRTCQISVWIVHSSSRYDPEPFGVYIFHGTPAGPFWRNSAPLVRCRTIVEARRVAEALYGIQGSGDLAQLVNR